MQTQEQQQQLQQQQQQVMDDATLSGPLMEGLLVGGEVGPVIESQSSAEARAYQSKLLKQINGMKTKEDLLAFVERMHAVLDPINLVTSLYRLARLYGALQGSQEQKQVWKEDLMAQPCFGLLMGTIHMHLSETRALLSMPGPYPDTGVNARCLANLVWSLVKLEVAEDGNTLALQVVAAASPLVTAFIEDCSGQGLANLLWGYSRLPIAYNDIMTSLLEKLVSMLQDPAAVHQLDSQALANSIFAVAHVRSQSRAEVFSELEATPSWKSLVTHFLLLLAHQCSTMLARLVNNQQVPRSHSQVVDSDQNFSCQALVGIMWSFAVLLGSACGTQDPVCPLFMLVRELLVGKLKASIGGLQLHQPWVYSLSGSFNEQALAHLVFAYDKAGLLNGPLLQAVLDVATQRLTRSHSHSSGQLPYQPQDLCTLLRAGCSGLADSSPFFFAINRFLSQRPPALQPWSSTEAAGVMEAVQELREHVNNTTPQQRQQRRSAAGGVRQPLAREQHVQAAHAQSQQQAQAQAQAQVQVQAQAAQLQVLNLQNQQQQQQTLSQLQLPAGTVIQQQAPTVNFVQQQVGTAQPTTGFVQSQPYVVSYVPDAVQQPQFMSQVTQQPVQYITLPQGLVLEPQVQGQQITYVTTAYPNFTPLPQVAGFASAAGLSSALITSSSSSSMAGSYMPLQDASSTTDMTTGREVLMLSHGQLQQQQQQIQSAGAWRLSSASAPTITVSSQPALMQPRTSEPSDVATQGMAPAEGPRLATFVSQLPPLQQSVQQRPVHMIAPSGANPSQSFTTAPEAQQSQGLAGLCLQRQNLQQQALAGMQVQQQPQHLHQQRFAGLQLALQSQPQSRQQSTEEHFLLQQGFAGLQMPLQQQRQASQEQLQQRLASLQQQQLSSQEQLQSRFASLQQQHPSQDQLQQRFASLQQQQQQLSSQDQLQQRFAGLQQQQQQQLSSQDQLQQRLAGLQLPMQQQHTSQEQVMSPQVMSPQQQQQRLQATLDTLRLS